MRKAILTMDYIPGLKKDGLLLIDKPHGVTSHDIVDMVRKKMHIKRVGHAGTLDPLAEGLLIILVGKYTKLFSRFVNFDKEYVGVLKLGEVTTTGDAQGSIVRRSDYAGINKSDILKAFSNFDGEIEQIPPMFSALHVGGKRLYQLARSGITVQRKPRKVAIYSIQILNVNPPFVEFYIHCSKGTYIRKLAEDIGEKLGCGAHIIKIKRLSVGPFKLSDAITVDNIDESHLKPITF